MVSQSDAFTGDPGRSTFRDPRLWVVGGLVVAAALVIGGFLFLHSGGAPTARKLPQLAALKPRGDLFRGDVQQITGNRISLSNASGLRTIDLAATTRVEALVASDASTIAPGDYLAAGGVPNLINPLALQLLVRIPAAEVGNATSEPPLTRGGFTGWEAYTQANEAESIWGRVESVGQDGVHLINASGSVLVRLDAKSVVRTVTAGGADLIHGGDHIAIAGTEAGAPSSVLVLPGQ